MDESELRNLPRSERIETLFSFTPFPYQRDLINNTQNTNVVKAAVKPGRQVGKTETGGAIGADAALTGSDVMILGPFEDTVSEMMEAARNHLTRCEEKFSEAGYTLGTEQRNKTDWKFANGGRLRARTVGTDGTQIRGKNPDVVLVDEAAYIPDGIFQEVIEPFFSTHDSYEYYLFSTPAGKSGYFYEKVTQDESFYSPHWPSEISPLISDEWLAEKREELDSQTYAQEYLGEFVDAAGSFLPLELVRPCIEPSTELGPDKWLGVDVARQGRDRTVYIEVDSEGNVRVVDSEEQSTVPGVIGRIKSLHRENEYQSVVVDENAVGGGVVDDPELQSMGIVKGVTLSTKSKHEMYTTLKRDFEGENLTLPNHERLRAELTGLEYDMTQTGYYKVHHRDGGHDDFADGLALANFGRHGAGEVLGGDAGGAA